MNISEILNIGSLYSRYDLKKRFNIIDATINTGVFKPRGFNSIWLFVTEQKTTDRTQYKDLLKGDILYWDGQTSGKTDNKIINHSIDGNEILLFYRRKKYEFDDAAFRYEGVFNYVSHEIGNPSHFILRRSKNK